MFVRVKRHCDPLNVSINTKSTSMSNLINFLKKDVSPIWRVLSRGNWINLSRVPLRLYLAHNNCAQLETNGESLSMSTCEFNICNKHLWTALVNKSTKAK